MPWQPYNPNPVLLCPRSCETVSGWMRCPDCGNALRPRDDGRGWNCYPCDVLVTDDAELRRKYAPPDE